MMKAGASAGLFILSYRSESAESGAVNGKMLKTMRLFMNEWNIY
jgi:hypothetical protein